MTNVDMDSQSRSQPARQTDIKEVKEVSMSYLPLQLGNLNTTIVLSQVITIIPGCVTELRALHDNLRVDVIIIDEDVDSCTQAKHQGCVFSIEDEISTCQKDLPWSRDGGRRRHLNVNNNNSK